MALTELSDSQREQLVLEHLPRVQYVARRIHSRVPPQVLLEDLVHAGILGLMDAVRKYDPGKNVQLKHYADFRIRGAILDSLRLLDWSPRALRRQARRLDQAIIDCKARLGRDPSEQEISEELAIPLKSLQGLRNDLRGLDVGSLQADADSFGGEEAIQPWSGSGEESPYEQALRSEIKTLLDNAIEQLPPREREVVILYHLQELNMKQVGEHLQIGESRVSQIHTAALQHLRESLPDSLTAVRSYPAPTRRPDVPITLLRPPIHSVLLKTSGRAVNARISISAD